MCRSWSLPRQKHYCQSSNIQLNLQWMIIQLQWSIISSLILSSWTPTWQNAKCLLSRRTAHRHCLTGIALTKARLITLSKSSGFFISLAKPGTTACPPNPANTNPTPPSQFPDLHSGPIFVGAGWVIEPVRNPSKRRIAIRSRDERVERSEGSDKRWRGRRVVGRILAISWAYEMSQHVWVQV